MKQKAILIIALLVFACLMITPISAWTQQDSITLSAATVNSDCLGGLGFHNYTVSKGITRFDYSGYCLFATGARYTGSWTGNLWQGAANRGNVSVVWVGGSFVNWSYYPPITATFEFSNMNQALTGYQGFALVNSAGAQALETYMENGSGQPVNSLSNATVYASSLTGITHTDYSVATISVYSTDERVLKGTHTVYTGSAVTIPVASFTCVPTSQYLNTDVVCTDTSTNAPTSWLWTIDGFGVNGWQTHTGQNFSWQSAYAGIFNVNLKANNSAGFDWENKTNYVNISGTPPGPTVTPTPVPTIPAGYVRNNLYIWDQNDAQIVGADVDVLDVEAATWTNTTADADGWITIDTLPYHTVNVYAHYPTSNIYLPNEILGLETGYYGGHNWVLVLYPYTTTPAGFVTLYINTRDYDSKTVLVGVNLQIKNLVTGVTTGESTGSTDSVRTVVVNATNYQITGSKSGYLSKTININSGEASSKIVVVELSRATVTPTVTGTVIPGETTVRPTYSPGCDPAAYDAATCTQGKDSDMMNQIRDAGPGLIGLAIIATVIGLIKLMSKR